MARITTPTPEEVLAALVRPMTRSELGKALWETWGRQREIECNTYLVTRAVQPCIDACTVVVESEGRQRAAYSNGRAPQVCMTYRRAT